MIGLSKARLMVVGGGALGACTALGLIRAGARVTLVDSAPATHSASGVAAGMLAPAFESVLDPQSGLSFDLLRRARDLWTPLAQGLGEIGLHRGGGVWVDLPGCPPRRQTIAEALERIGARIARPPPLALDSALAATAVFTPEEARLEPLATLSALDHAFRAEGGEVVRARLEAMEGGWASLSDGRRLAADALVVAAGAQSAHLAPELAQLIPIKGQILSYPDLTVPVATPALRCAQGYAVGGADGLKVGATMEAGVRDLTIDPEVTERLHALAVRLYPGAAALTPRAGVGVRAASADGRPLIGPSAREGVWIAAGARRNGWLLAPLAAQIIVAGLQGHEANDDAALLHPRRNDARPATGAAAISRD